MTPAVDIVKIRKIPHRLHEYDHDPGSLAYGREAALKLGVDESRVFKTLVADLGDKQFAVGIVPVSHQLNLKLLTGGCFEDIAQSA